MNISKALVDVRKERNPKLSQYRLAKSLGMTVNSIVNLEKGNVYPKKDLLKRISVLLKVTPDYIYLNSIEDECILDQDKIEFNKCKSKLKEIMQRANQSLYVEQ